MSRRYRSIVILAIAGLGLTACGKESYTGSYSGYQVQTPAVAATGTTQPQMYAQPQTSSVVANLNENSDSVTGTYTVNGMAASAGFNSGYGTGYGNGTYAAGSMSYSFTASSTKSGSLTNVALISTGAYGCSYVNGTLTTSDKGRSITGDLQSVNGSASGANYNACPPLHITLNRTN